MQKLYYKMGLVTNRFLKSSKGRLTILTLLAGLHASAQSPEVYSTPFTNTGSLNHTVGTGANAFSVIAGGSYNGTGGTDAFIGPAGLAGNQEIAGTVAPLFGTLVVSDGTGSRLNITNTAGVSIATGVTFTSGVISNRALGSGVPLAFLNGSSSPTASSTSYVDGYVSKTGNSAFTFPVGDLSAASGAQYHPVSISIATGSTTAKASYTAGATPNSGSLQLNVLAVDPSAYWTFSSTNNVTASVTITTRDETSVFHSSHPETTMIFIAGYNVNTHEWENLSGSNATITGDNQTLSSGAITLSTYSAFTVGATNVFGLPVTLVSFTGTADGCNADLSWTTAIEQNSDHYSIELSTDGASFSEVARVRSQNSSTGATYSYQYKGLSSHTTYFRLNAVDIDGKSAYSPIVAVTSNCNPGGKITVSPNPATDLVNIQGLEDGVNQLTLLDAGGKRLTGLRAAGASQSLNISSYPKGLYILRIQDANGKITTIKVMKE